MEGRRKGRMGGRPESAGLRLCHVKQGRSARGSEWRERRMKERSFLDSESPKRAPCAKLNWVLNLGAARVLR